MQCIKIGQTFLLCIGRTSESGSKVTLKTGVQPYICHDVLPDGLLSCRLNAMRKVKSQIWKTLGWPLVRFWFSLKNGPNKKLKVYSSKCFCFFLSEAYWRAFLHAHANAKSWTNWRFSWKEWSSRCTLSVAVYQDRNRATSYWRKPAYVICEHQRRSLVNAFVVIRCLDSIMLFRNSTTLASFCPGASVKKSGLSLTWSRGSFNTRVQCDQ